MSFLGKKTKLTTNTCDQLPPFSYIYGLATKKTSCNPSNFRNQMFCKEMSVFQEIHLFLTNQSITNGRQDNSLYCIMNTLICITLRSNNHHTEPFSCGKCPDCLTSSSVVQPQFTPSAFWCGCSVCSPAPTVCSLPFNNLPLAKSLTLRGLQQHCLHFRRWETRGLVHTSGASNPAAQFILQKSGVASHLHSNPAWSPSDGRQRHHCSHRAKHLFSHPPEIKYILGAGCWMKIKIKFETERLFSHSSPEVGKLLCAHLKS